MHVCYFKVRWRGQGSRILGMDGRRLPLGNGVGGVKVMMREELCERIIEIRRVSDRAMAVVVFVFEEDVLR